MDVAYTHWVGMVPGVIQNISLLIVLAWVLSLFGRRAFYVVTQKSETTSILIGAVFGCTTVALMFAPVEYAPGIILDARGAPLLMSGVFGGPVSALVSAVIAGTGRYLIGGLAANTGIVSVLIFTSVGTAFGFWIARTGREVTVKHLLILCTVAWGFIHFSVFLMPQPTWIPIFREFMPLYLVANLLGVGLLAVMLRREQKRIENEIELSEQIARTNSAAAAKSRFLTAMSHEIRTPLNGVLGVIQGVSNEKIPRDIRQSLRVAQESGQYLLALVNQVLDYARFEAGTFSRSEGHFAIANLTNSLESLFCHQAEEKGITLTTSVIGPEDTMLIGDSGLIRQILFNFIANALKFTAHGSVNLIVQIRDLGTGVARVEFSVSDTGPGIAAEDKERVFDEFIQGAEGERSGGSGLGLSIAKRLSDALGGRVSVESEVGIGTTFRLEIDLGISDRKVEEFAAPMPVEGHLRRLKVLVAEDNTVNQLVIRGMLEQDNHDVTIVENGLLAFEAVRDAPLAYDVILMDVQMPEMPGIEATKRIRQHIPDAAEVPIIAVTANAFEEQRLEYLESGMQDVVIKPIDVKQLNAVLHKHVGDQSSVQVDQNTPAVGGLTDAGSVPVQRLYKPEVVDSLLQNLGSEKLVDMIEILETNARRILADICCLEDQPEAMQASVHELTGMVSNFGIPDVMQLVEKLSDEGKEHADVIAVCDDIQEALGKSLTDMRAYLADERREVPENSPS